MPLPTIVCVAFATGVFAALAGRAELRVSPRPPLLSRSFGAFMVFCCALLVPAGVYFYLFHGDWFLLYTVDVREVPSAVALVGFVIQALLGAAGFAAGAALVRAQRETLGGLLAFFVLLVAGLVPVFVSDRLGVVGSFAQFEGGFGLAEYGHGALFQGTLLMGALIFLGFAYLMVRLHVSGRRIG